MGQMRAGFVGLAFLSAAWLALSPGPAGAVQDYDSCLALAQENPRAGLRAAEDWLRAGGGAPAAHCRAVSLAGSGALLRAADALFDLGAEEGELPEPARAEMLLQAGELYLAVGDIDIGLLAAEGAHSLDPSPDTLLMRARLLAEANDWVGALSDIEGVLRGRAPQPDVLTLRAAARRQTGALLEARSDALWALELSPDWPEAWRELGSVEAALGSKDAARRAWSRAIEVDTDGDVADLARNRIQRLEAGL